MGGGYGNASGAGGVRGNDAGFAGGWARSGWIGCGRAGGDERGEVITVGWLEKAAAGAASSPRPAAWGSSVCWRVE